MYFFERGLVLDLLLLLLKGWLPISEFSRNIMVVQYGGIAVLDWALAFIY